MFFIRAQKVTVHLGYFGRKFVAKNFQKSPNLVTLGTTDRPTILQLPHPSNQQTIKCSSL